jgi:hypothetical protein
MLAMRGYAKVAATSARQKAKAARLEAERLS